MIVDERFLSYLRSLEGEELAYLAKIREEAIADDVPIIRRDTQSFLKFLLETVRPQSILEVGAAVGFSALMMEAYAPKGCTVTTIENYPPRIAKAKENLALCKKEDAITLLAGDAQEILPSLTGTYDFIFMDAAKGQYPIFLPEVKRLMHSGSVLVTDNVLQDGDLIESHFAIERRNRTIHKRMRSYLYELTHDEEFATAILPVGDGLAVSTRK